MSLARIAVARFHRLDADADRVFLAEDLVDPLTRVAFRPTNHVARCKTCGLVTLRETWEAVGGCPNGHTTADRWDPEMAARGDGQLGAPPVVAAPVAAAPPPAAPPPAATQTKARPAWLVPFLGLLGLAALVAVGVLIARTMGGDEAPPPEPVEAAAEAPTARAATAGETTGELSEGDFRTDAGHFQDLYTFAADSSGRVLAFTLATEDFYPDLVVTTPSGERVEAEQLDNIIDEGEDATTITRRMRVAGLRGPGEFHVLVSSRQPLGTGAYTLTIREEAPVKALSAGQSVNAELGRFSQQADGFYQDRFRFRGIAGREHTITVTSSAFAPTAVVDGNARGQTERGGDRVVYTFTPSRTGTYTLTVSSRERARAGAYAVRLAVAPAPPPEPTASTAGSDRPDRPSRPTASGVLRAGGSATRDSLGAGQTKTYSFRGRVGDRVTVEARANGFSPSLVLIGPDGQRVAGPGSGDRARVRSTLATEGTYRVVVSGSGAGTYSVELAQRAAPASDDIPRLPGQTPRAPAPTPPPAETPPETPTETDPPADPPSTDGEYAPAPIGDGTYPTPQP